MVTDSSRNKKEKEDSAAAAAASESAKVEPNPTQARRIADESGGVLVEWTNRLGNRHRSWVKSSMLIEDNGQNVVVDSPERGVPYGDDLNKLFTLDPEMDRNFATALKEQGIWTYDDVMAQPQVVQGVLQSVYGVALSNVLQAAGAATKTAKAE